MRRLVFIDAPDETDKPPEVEVLVNGKPVPHIAMVVLGTPAGEVEQGFALLKERFPCSA